MADIIDLIYEDHDWVRRHFFHLDGASTVAELTAVWEPLAARLDTYAAAEQAVFHPALLRDGRPRDPQGAAADAVDPHRGIRDAVRTAGDLEVGTPAWFEAVGRARTASGRHLDEEERGAMPDFVRSSSPELRHDLAMRWLVFRHGRPAAAGAGVGAGVAAAGSPAPSTGANR